MQRIYWKEFLGKSCQYLGILDGPMVWTYTFTAMGEGSVPGGGNYDLSCVAWPS